MGGKIKTFCVQPLHDSTAQLIEMTVQGADILSCHVRIVDGQEELDELKQLIQKNAGHFAITYPYENSYIHQMEFPGNAVEKTVQKAMDLHAEVAVPVKTEAALRYRMELAMHHEKKQVLQFIIPKEKTPFVLEIEQDLLEVNPADLFEGCSKIFNFEKDKMTALYFNDSKLNYMSWGVNGRVMGLRINPCKNIMQEKEYFIQTISQSPRISVLYTWCSSQQTLLMDEIAKKLQIETCRHLNQNNLPQMLRSHASHIMGICSAFNLAQGSKNPVSRDYGNAGIVFRDASTRKAILKTLVLVVVALIGVNMWGATRIQHQKRVHSALYEQLEKKFYKIFSKATPMINPVLQLKDKVGQGKLRNAGMIEANRLLKNISEILECQDSNVEIENIVYDKHVLKYDGQSSSIEGVQNWVELLGKKGFKKVKILNMSHRTDINLFNFEISVDVK